jgi:hypothetical protein
VVDESGPHALEGAPPVVARELPIGGVGSCHCFCVGARIDSCVASLFARMPVYVLITGREVCSAPLWLFGGEGVFSTGVLSIQFSMITRSVSGC